MNAIRIDSLDAATGYEYRIVSTRIDKFDPYDVRYGESVTTPWYAFRTPDPAARSFTFVAMNDIHDTPQKCRRLLETQPLDEAQMVFYVGDMIETGTTQQIFSDPHDQRLVDYLTGRFG